MRKNIREDFMDDLSALDIPVLVDSASGKGYVVVNGQLVSLPGQGKNGKGGKGGGSTGGSGGAESGEDTENQGSKPIFGPPTNKDALENIEQQLRDHEEQAKKEAEEAGRHIETEEEREARLEKIKDLLEKGADKAIENAKDIAIADRKKQYQIQKDKAEEERHNKEMKDKYDIHQFDNIKPIDGGIEAFKEDILDLVKSQIEKKRMKVDTWGRPSRKQLPGTYLKGHKRKSMENPNVPLLYVYFDQSGSWDDSDIQIGMQALAALNEFVKSGELEMQIYYFGAEYLGTTPPPSGRKGYESFNLVSDHIKEHEPDNVVIMTDDNADNPVRLRQYTHLDTCPPVIVDGGMFLLFRGGLQSKYVERVYHGEKGDFIYAI